MLNIPVYDKYNGENEDFCGLVQDEAAQIVF